MQSSTSSDIGRSYASPTNHIVVPHRSSSRIPVAWLVQLNHHWNVIQNCTRPYLNLETIPILRSSSIPATIENGAASRVRCPMRTLFYNERTSLVRREPANEPPQGVLRQFFHCDSTAPRTACFFLHCGCIQPSSLETLYDLDGPRSKCG